MESKPNVLVVEDDKINMLVITKLLNSAFSIIQASNSNEVFSTLKSHKIDVILMDINLGSNSKDGVQIMQEITELYANSAPKMFAVTSYTEEEEKKMFLDKGFDGYFAKPINKIEIIEAVKAAVA